VTVVARWTGREAGFLRQAMRLTVRDFAEDLGVNPRTISRWESTRDPHTPGPELQQALDTMLDRATEGERQRFADAVKDLSPNRRYEEAPLLAAPSGGAGPAVGGVVADLAWREPGLMLTTLDTTSASHGRLIELFQEADHLGVQVIKVPPATLAVQAMTRFREVRELIGGKQTFSLHRELVRVAARFGAVVGEILFNEGQFPLAQRWYGTARRAALEVGDQYLADIALSGSTYLPTYSADPGGVLALVAPRLDKNPPPSPAIAWLWAFRAKAHALLNEREAFEMSIERSRQVLDGSPGHLVGPGIFSFLPEKLAFYEARGRVELGDTTGALAAAQRASDLYDFAETMEPALVRFEQASGLVQAGEVPEACRVATAAVLDERTHHGITIVIRAREFDSLLGSSSQKAVREWREVLATLRPPPSNLAEAR
jgi:transcriptional regulator with XRE-family HTH domain